MSFDQLVENARKYDILQCISSNKPTNLSRDTDNTLTKCFTNFAKMLEANDQDILSSVNFIK